MQLKDFVKNYENKKVDWDGSYGGQCVDLFRQYVNDVLELKQPNSVKGACDFWKNYDKDENLNLNFEKIPNTPQFIPIAGDVMIWNDKVGKGYGHISIVLEANIAQFVSFDQNWRALNVCEKTTHNYDNVFGVLRPRKYYQETVDNKDRKIKELEELIKLKEDNTKKEIEAPAFNFKESAWSFARIAASTQIVFEMLDKVWGLKIDSATQSATATVLSGALPQLIKYFVFIYNKYK